MQDLTATVTYDQGQLYIYSITLTEQPIYRAARLLCFLVLFAAADAALLLLFAHVGERGAARRRALRLPRALAGITLLACLPLFSNYLYFGHDLEFHMQRIAAMAAELSYGQFPVRLNELGTELGRQYGVPFLPSEFRKKDGYKRSLQLSAEYGLYRQDYCGCVFSKREREATAK